MKRRVPTVVAFGLAALCWALPAGASAQTYEFGNSMVLSTKLRMASFGPMRSVAVQCSTADYACLRADYLAIAVPRRCGDAPPSNPRDYSIGEDRFHVLGTVRYDDNPVTLVDVPSKPGFAFGYTPAGGQFIMMAPLVKGRMMELANAKPGRPLQSAFDAAKMYLLPRTSDDPMFACSPIDKSSAK